MRPLAPRDLLHALDDRFRLLTGGSRTAPPRQQTLRAVIDWSYALLFGTGAPRVRAGVGVRRRVLARRGRGRRRAAARGIDTAESPTSSRGSSTSRSSCPAPTPGVAVPTAADARAVRPGTPGRERRGRPPLGRGTRATSRLRSTSRRQHGCARPNWFTRFSESIDDVRVAMEWSLEAGDSDLALAITNGLGWYWNMGGRIDDTWRWMTPALALPNRPIRAPRSRALAWAGAIGMCATRERALAYGAEASRTGAGARRSGSRSRRRRCSTAPPSPTSSSTGSVRRRCSKRRTRTYLAVGDDWSLAMAALLRGALCIVNGDFERRPDLSATRQRTLRGARQLRGAAAIALRHLADVLMSPRALRRARPPRCTTRWSGLRAVGAIGRHEQPGRAPRLRLALQGRFDDAERWLDEALDAAERQRYVPNLALIHNLRGVVLRRAGRLDEAERVTRHALALYCERGVPVGVAYARRRSVTSPSCGATRTRADALHRNALVAAVRRPATSARSALALEGLAGAAAACAATTAAPAGCSARRRTPRRDRWTAASRRSRTTSNRALARVHDRAAMTTLRQRTSRRASLLEHERRSADRVAHRPLPSAGVSNGASSSARSSGKNSLPSGDLDDLGDARDRVAQPVRPPQVEELVGGAPHDQRRHVAAARGRARREQVAGRRASAISRSNCAAAFGRADDRFEEGAHDLEGEAARILVTRSRTPRRARLEVGEERRRARREPPGLGQLDGRRNASGGTLSWVSQFVSVSVREPLGLARGEDLRDRTAGVVRDEIDRSELSRVAERGQQVGEARQRKVLVGRAGLRPCSGRSIAMQRRRSGGQLRRSRCARGRRWCRRRARTAPAARRRTSMQLMSPVAVGTNRRCAS